MLSWTIADSSRIASPRTVRPHQLMSNKKSLGMISKTTQFIITFVSGYSGEELHFLLFFFFMINDPSWFIPGGWSLAFFLELLSLWPEPRTQWSNTNLPAYWRGNKRKFCKNPKKGIMLISIGVTQWDQEHFNYLSYPVRDKAVYI